MAIKRKEALAVSPAANKGGRPRKLEPDVRTLQFVHGLGRLQCTTKECAAALAVDEKTWLKFRDDYDEVREVFEQGMGNGRVSLRRTQFRLSDKHPAMAIFLGKNILGQTDRMEHAGDPTQPVVFQIIRAGAK